ncbi:hypothetical protein L226DRAFT_540255 [Lentinus tigrinus ALCF2SS1-7]|uniref:Nephrocystin 3-like N-terminal domain-containing protein n=1 Tax=Lentinus tigrinus ALCF2SS1-6 TaxID=1328759 RepID=A0A5C2S522_9APHY|nr:hypothetical protein L227DRAFT_576764 [Lentinus tigrinus ALCF2SS1-6]RPD68944.1 hypothetical protein L226DRAFT_540255 [Lentinus tigrinus ALCF2SS1-7]
MPTARLTSTKQDALGLSASDVLDNVCTALDKSRALLDLAPVPGLAAAVDVLLGILDQVKKMKANTETVNAVAQEIQKLSAVIADVARRVDARAARLQMTPGERAKMLEGLRTADGWRQRVERLRKELEDLREKAVPCAEGRWVRRFLRTTRDEETLQAVCADLARVVQRYQLSGVLSIEALTEHNLARLEATYEEVKRIAETQKEEREQKTIEAIPHADAGFEAASNADKGSYLSGTRDAVWKHLQAWVSSDKPVCFLVGAAGMGKSTIASEFCRRHHHQHELGASFFFRRGDTSAGSTAMFFPTIAYQLAHARPELRPYIARAAAGHVHGAGGVSRMEYAVDDLLRRPLREAEEGHGGVPLSRRVFVVVDALDECDGNDLVPECLRLLLSCALRHPSSFRVLITSRPDPDHVQRALRRDAELKRASVLLFLRDIEEQRDIDRDIGELIRSRLCTVEEGAEWHATDPSVVARLTEQSQGVFAYARTAVDFIVRSAGRAQMEHRLQLLLTPGNPYGLGNLDLLYRTVLETAFPPVADLDPETHKQLQLILAWIALCQTQSPGWVSPFLVEALSGVSCRESIPVLTKLRSVLIFDSAGELFDIEHTGIRAMHVTFRDFLVDRARCGDTHYVDAGRMHARLAVDLLRWLHNNGRDSDEFRPAIWVWSDHVVQAHPTEELVGLLREIFASVETERPSLFFYHSHEVMYGPDKATSLLRWVDKNIGRDLAKIIGEDIRLRNPRLTVCYEEEDIRVSEHPPGSQGAPTSGEIDELKDRNRTRWLYFRDCWTANYPDSYHSLFGPLDRRTPGYFMYRN